MGVTLLAVLVQVLVGRGVPVLIGRRQAALI